MDPMDRREFLQQLTALAGPPLFLSLFGPDGVSGGILGFRAVRPVPRIVDIAQSDDVSPIEHLRRMRAVLVDSDNLLGPRHVIAAVENYIQLIQQLRDTRASSDDGALLHIKAEYAEFVGWLYQDYGDLATAQHWLDRALEWSHAVGDREMSTFILARKSQLAGDMHDGASAVDLAAGAATMAQPGSRLRAVAPTYAAYGYALGGRDAECLGAIDEARNLAAKLDPDPNSPWAPWLDPTYIEVQRARCLSVLGDHAQAAILFQQAFHDLPPAYRRDRGVYLAREALAHAGSRDPEQAVAVGMRALAIAQETQSGRIVTELVRLASTLERWQRVQSVADFRDRMGQVVPAAAQRPRVR